MSCPAPDRAASRRFVQVRDGPGAGVAAGGCRLPGNDSGAAMKMRAVYRISVVRGVPSPPGHAARRAGVALPGGPARPRPRGTRAGAPPAGKELSR